MAERGRKRANPEQRRAEILDAALQVFEKHGFERSTTKAIAAEAGVAEGTLFIYFKTKKDILISALRREIIDPLPSILSGETMSDEEIMRNLISNRLELFRKNSGLIRLILAEGLDNRELQQDFFQRIFTPGSSAMIEYLTRRMDEKIFRSLDPSSVVRMLISMVTGYGLAKQIFNEDPSGPVDEKIVETMTVVFLNGIRTQQPPE